VRKYISSKPSGSKKMKQTTTWEYDELNRLRKEFFLKKLYLENSYKEEMQEIYDYSYGNGEFKREERYFNKYGLIKERKTYNSAGKLLDHFFYSYTYYK
jgi:hypothetical protein